MRTHLSTEEQNKRAAKRRAIRATAREHRRIIEEFAMQHVRERYRNRQPGEFTIDALETTEMHFGGIAKPKQLFRAVAFCRHEGRLNEANVRERYERLCNSFERN